MRSKLEELLTLQKLQFDPRADAAELQSLKNRLKETLPEAAFVHYERLASRGKKWVAIVRGGVCSECHLGIPSGTLGNLGNDTLLHQCDNCGRYLYRPAESAQGPADAKPSGLARARASRRSPRRSPSLPG